MPDRDPLVPAGRPEAERAFIAGLCALARVSLTKPVLVGRRAYYRDTMGHPEKNDRGLYDDAIFLLSPATFRAFNANVDPTRYKPGVATILPGTYLYEIGTHNRTKAKSRQYEALIQASGIDLSRDPRAAGKAPTIERNVWGGFNIHNGGWTTTGSEGCQTIHPSQWTEFIALVKGEMKIAGIERITYLLTEREEG